MATENVPSHHIQQEFCTTRPAYRQGRELKAVKVYTVNQESKYLLIQGVPTVGASRDLIKLCALYGAVEEYRILDDYPATEKFTEVYWVKFSRIQSARFAKRKLDNHSFFGGSLHVCYAPEYESIEDTREKLQERRRVIANKTRQQQSSGTLSTSSVKETADNGEVVTPEEVSTEWQNERTNERQPVVQSTATTLDSSPIIQTQINSPYFNLQIPPPPHVTYAGGIPNRFHPQNFNHARVPSSHSTLPHGYDPRAHNPTYMPQQFSDTHLPQNSINHSKPADNLSSPVPNKNLQLKNIKFNQGGQGQDQLSSSPQHGGEAKVPEDLLTKKTKQPSGKIVLKDFKKSGTQPKFIPRQAEAALKRKSESVHNDALSKQIRRNAVTLRESMQGPTLPDGSLQSKLPASSAVVSVEKSITNIRQKVSQFSDGIPVKKLKTS